MVEASSGVSPTASPSSTPGATAPSGGGGSGYSSKTSISSVGDLKSKAPEVYDAMLKGIAQSIISKMRQHQDHLKEMWNKARRDSQG